MTPLKPYLIRSIYEWILDNSLTPHLLVNAEHPGVVLPTDFVEDGRIVLNIRPEAIQGLTLGNEEVQFNARFSGKAMHIVVPTKAVLAIYAKENGKGMVFDPEDQDDETPPSAPEPTPPQRPQLRVVK
ncbi:ClpXP protease specificity-enhancing factor [Methylomonas sp. MED-D]|uniref:Stringent starvation protein B n=1 Tax=Methylomonas koyamae TaxID=702114 RepID=A0A177PAJ5_9GAMM|nr:MULTISPECIES: ClpXP protease specificity-enhancing factor [Methylomonas]NJA07369.1 ClpXP protease specificity-enhancing factor [Methylococcaceae bacterium WWC4]MDT4329521.1 ClpXP protease specificity-enhancing factor [Methylomonas sp. MV1]OAI26459.1 stringent starvation protein B [Methylomonas koyamae]OHX36803.1 ClpXP protease specificity-enhancing factor [Methylomonas sp. LWB]WGS87306.1 ClpXP protease specificity-enhancing factor [Methylomonas sp. UP202]